MKLITTRGLIRKVAGSWKEAYCQGNRWTYGPDKELIYDRLKDLDLNATTKAEVDAIIGNSSWTNIKCDECSNPCSSAMQLGEEPDYESSTATICLGCLSDALAMAKDQIE